jgi:hypothetical protein
MLMYKKKSCPYIKTSPHHWLLRDGVHALGSSLWCFFGEGCLPNIIMTASSLGKGTASLLMGALSISMPWDREPMVMKLFIKLWSQSLCLMV